jgi:hypothetical protein
MSMKDLRALFTRHPATVGETYFQHLMSATGFAVHMLAGGLCCLVHGLLPFLFEKTGSDAIARLHDRMVVNRARRPAVAPAERPAPPAGAIGAN